MKNNRKNRALQKIRCKRNFIKAANDLVRQGLISGFKFVKIVLDANLKPTVYYLVKPVKMPEEVKINLEPTFGAPDLFDYKPGYYMRQSLKLMIPPINSPFIVPSA